MNNEINRKLLRHKAETLTEIEAAEVLEYISIMESLREQVTDPLEETIVRLLCEALIGTPEFERNQLRREAIKN